MSRPLRIEYPGAWYHIMNRGRRGDNIFEADEDREILLTLLKEANWERGQVESAGKSRQRVRGESPPHSKG